MAKKPESISILGRQLVGEAQERGDRLAKEEAKRQEKGAIIGKGIGFGLDIFKKVGDQVLGRTNEQFLKQENFYARQAIFDVNLKQDQNHMNFWNERLAHKGGEDSYFREQAAAKIMELPEHGTFKNRTTPSDYSAHMYAESSKLAETMKQEAKINYTTASERIARYGSKPDEFLKNEVLKNRADNVYDALTLPLVNLFAGKDTRPIPQAIQESVTGKNGLVEQGKVNAKELKTIYEQSGNYESSLDTALELEAFRKSFKERGKEFKDAAYTTGDVETVWGPSDNGDQVQHSVRKIMLGTTEIGYQDAYTGARMDATVKNAKKSMLAGNVSAARVLRAQTAAGRTYSEDDKETLTEYKQSIINKFEEKDRAKAVDSWNTNYYGTIAIGVKKLEDQFGDIEGTTGDFFHNLSAQMMIEDIKLAEDKKFLPFRDSGWNRNTSLLQGSDHYDPFIALKALQSLVDEGGVSQTVLNQKMKQRIIESVSSTRDMALTPAQIQSRKKIMAELNIQVSQ
tara:strand:- start:5825 stop:7360 length:1536 start_codon:yes stop_codon:yes gene_type:complete